MSLKGIIAGLFLACVAATAFAASQAEVDAQFRLAMNQAERGQREDAIRRLRQLATLTDAPRIRLELARLLLRSGNSADALELFRHVYLAPGTPQSVKRNILPFMEEAELRVLRVRYGARIVSDSNPSRVGEGGTVYFNGIPLEYQPPARKKTSYGVEPWFSAERLWDNGYLTKISGSLRLFEDKDLRSGAYQVAVGRKIPSVPGLFIQASVEGEVNHGASYVLPNLEAWKRFRLSERAGVGLGGQVGYMVSENDPVSGPFYRGYVFGDWTFSRNATVFTRFSVETLDSRNDFYDYVSTKLDFGFDLTVAGVDITPKVSWKQTYFPQHNAFWNLKREDVTIRPELRFSSEQVEWNGIRPEISVFYEWRTSNVEIYKYDQFGGYLNLKRLF